MDKIVARRNVEHLRDALERECDETRREMIAHLLAEAEAKLNAALTRKDENESPANRPFWVRVSKYVVYAD